MIYEKSIRVRHFLTKTWLRKPVLALRHRNIKSTDIFIASYPRSGNTWLLFMLYNTLTSRSPAFHDVREAIPLVGWHKNVGGILPSGSRLIKTHESFRSEYRKAIYLVRDVRAVAISEYKFLRWNGRITCDFDQFLDQFVYGRASGLQSWGENVNSWLASSLVDTGDLIVIRYEDMYQNTFDTFKNVLNFIEYTTTDEIINATIRNNEIESMKKKEDEAKKALFQNRNYDDGNRVIRHGSVDAWQTELSRDQLAKIEKSYSTLLRQLNYPLMTI